MKAWKKTILYILSLALCLSMVGVETYAAGSCIVTSGDTARSGGRVYVTVSVWANNLYGFSGSLSYSDNLTLKEITQNVGGKWDVSYNNGVVVGQDLAMSSPLNSQTVAFTATFDVSSSAKTGDTVYVKFNGIEGSDGSSSPLSINGDTWERTVAAAPSGNNQLASLSCSNATLSPAFSGSTTNYSCTVPFSVSSLDLSYTKSDSGASVTVSGNSLVVGENTVTLTVKAANGSEKYYTISVTREQDPNYKAGTDAALRELTIEGAALSPKFNPNVTEYVAYVPFETGEVTLCGVPRDEKALGCSDKTVSLPLEGDNTVEFTCTAEDGITVATYTVHVYRMPAYAGGTLSWETPEPDAEPPEPEVPMIQFPMTVMLPLVGEVSTLLVGGIAMALVLILLFLLGFLIGRSGRVESGYEEAEEGPAPGLALEELAREELRPAAVYELKPAELKKVPTEQPERSDAEEERELRAEETEPADEADLTEEKTPDFHTEAADKAVAEMSLDDLLRDIRNL